jgi:hypothetical protein
MKKTTRKLIKRVSTIEVPGFPLPMILVHGLETQTMLGEQMIHGVAPMDGEGKAHRLLAFTVTRRFDIEHDRSQYLAHLLYERGHLLEVQIAEDFGAILMAILWAKSGTRADAMEFAARLPEYQGWNRDLLSREGGDVARRAVLAAADGFRNVVVECHDREPECPGRIAHFLAGLDYDVHGVCLTCPADVARSRAAARFSANPFGVCDPTADPAPFTPEDAGGHTARALAGYAGLSSWTVVEGL